MVMTTNPTPRLIDRFGRVHDYLRISLTDACNFRCVYCMPAGKQGCKIRPTTMTRDDILTFARTFVQLGVKKIRLTGGEPLFRADVGTIVQDLSGICSELSLTTNGFFIDKYLEVLLSAGIRSLNVSLDSLKSERFKLLTGRDYFALVWRNIGLLLKHQVNVKLNVVVMRGVNDDEISDFVELTRHLPIHIRFIEFMPFAGNSWSSNKVVRSEEILEQVGTKYPIKKIPDGLNDTTRKYQIPGFCGTIALIGTLSNPFCGTCNRLRLTADGRLKNCLYSASEVDLLSAMRNGVDIVPLIQNAVLNKAHQTGGQLSTDMSKISTDLLVNRQMVMIGG